jgi:hypothetical protein
LKPYFCSARIARQRLCARNILLYIVIFEDNPAAPADLRRRHMAAHLAFLERHGRRIKAAGPLQDASGGPSGGLWLVEADDAGEVDALVRDDPLWPTGLRRSFRIAHWAQVFADGNRLVQT